MIQLDTLGWPQSSIPEIHTILLSICDFLNIWDIDLRNLAHIFGMA